MKIAIGADHGGFVLKEIITRHLTEKGYEVTDFGSYNEDSVDYPDIAAVVAAPIKNGEFPLGILICGTGIGISISANKIPGIRAALCTDEYCGRTSRRHNDANVLCLGGRIVGPELAKSIVDAFLEGAFDGGRHKIRVDKISELEYDKE